ncbi:MAG: transcription elongation factor GreA [bacterium]|nr:transcription elongation factor GreA [bacterium]
MSEKEYMLQKDYDRLMQELERLKKKERPEVIARIAEARAFGDLSENAEYDAAREHQSFIEGRILQLEDRLAKAIVINPDDLPKDKIVFGSRVILYDLDEDREVEYTLVGKDADYSKKEISVYSPIGRGLLGKREGDVVEIKVPSRTLRYEVQKINPQDD